MRNLRSVVQLKPSSILSRPKSTKQRRDAPPFRPCRFAGRCGDKFHRGKSTDKKIVAPFQSDAGTQYRCHFLGPASTRRGRRVPRPRGGRRSFRRCLMKAHAGRGGYWPWPGRCEKWLRAIVVHRSNQSHLPRVVLVITPVPGESRFVSAKCLDASDHTVPTLPAILGLKEPYNPEEDARQGLAGNISETRFRNIPETRLPKTIYPVGLSMPRSFTRPGWS